MEVWFVGFIVGFIVGLWFVGLLLLNVTKGGLGFWEGVILLLSMT